MKPFGIIYKAVNTVNGKVYVGQTRESLKSRISKHRHKSTTQVKYPFYNAIRKYGFDNFEWSVLCEIYVDDIEVLNKAEKIFVSYYRSNVGRHGYNCTDGGGQCVMNDETRKKISTSKKKYKFTDEHRRNIAEATRNAMNNPEVKSLMSQKKREYWNNVSDEAKAARAAKISARLKGKPKPPRTEEHKRKLSEARRGNGRQDA